MDITILAVPGLVGTLPVSAVLLGVAVFAAGAAYRLLRIRSVDSTAE